MVAEETLRLLIQAEVSDAVAKMKQFESSLKNTEDRAKKTQENIAKFGTNMSMFVTAPIVGAGLAAIKAAASFETQKVSFGVLLGSVEKGNKLFKELQNLASETPLESGDINKSAQALLAFGSSAKNVTGQIRMLGDLAMGNPEKLDRITSAFGKLQSKGKASMEELNMLIEAGVPIMATLSKQTGLSNEQVYKLVENGKIGFEDVNTALTGLTATGGQFHDMMKKQSETIDGKLSTALDNLKVAGASAVTSLIPAIKGILDEVAKLADSFNSLDEGTKKAIITGLGIVALIGPITKVGGAIFDVGKGAIELVKMLPALRAGLMALATGPAVGIALLAGTVVALGAAAVITAIKLKEVLDQSAELDRVTVSASAQQQKVFLSAFSLLDSSGNVFGRISKAASAAGIDMNSAMTIAYQKASLTEGEVKKLREEWDKLKGSASVSPFGSALSDQIKKQRENTASLTKESEKQAKEKKTADLAEVARMADFNRALDEYRKNRDGAKIALGRGLIDQTELDNRISEFAGAFVKGVESMPNIDLEKVMEIKSLVKIKVDSESVETSEPGDKVIIDLQSELKKAANGAFGPIGELIVGEMGKGMDDAGKTGLTKFIDENKVGFQALSNSIQTTMGAAFDFIKAGSLSALEAEVNAMEEANNKQKESADSQLDYMKQQGMDTVAFEMNTKAQQKAAEEQLTAKKIELKKKEWEWDKIAKRGQIVMSTAVAVAQTLASGGALAIPLAAGVGALGLAQLAMLEATPAPAFYDGGIIQGSASGLTVRAGERNQSELILPLRKEKLRDLGIGSGGGNTTYINIDAKNMTARELAEELEKYKREVG